MLFQTFVVTNTSFPLNCPRLEHFLHRIADRLLISVALRAIEVTKPRFQCRPGCLFGRERIGNQRAKPESGNGTGTVGEGIFA